MRALRLGCVPYLNARPLVWGLEAALDVPSSLSRRFLAGEFDAALLPVYETFRLPAPRVVGGFGICSAGAVKSVIVAHRRPLCETPEIVTDPSSRTSLHLLKLLLSAKLDLAVPLVEQSEDPLAARLVIGDPALEFQRRNDGSWSVFDLGQAWHEWVGLPFVYAVWTLSGQAPEGIADALRATAREGLEARPSIAALEPDPHAALVYLTQAIRYTLGAPEREGMLKFRSLIISSGLLDPQAAPPEFL